MQIKRGSVYNFASYEELSFDFLNQGLILVHGATGSGKSTLCDIIPWILFGRTAKGGTVDEVLSWPGNQVTVGVLEVDNYVITRTRGPKAKDNDLYIETAGETDSVTRGKDLQDTQKIINNLLGLDIDLYLSGAYFHEFSQTAQFFTTTAKNRRAICEQIVDLSLAKSLQVNLKEAKKAKKQEADKIQLQSQTALSNITLLKQQLSRAQNLTDTWNRQHNDKLVILSEKYKTFESDKANKIESLIELKEKELIEKNKLTEELIDNISDIKRTVKPKSFYVNWLKLLVQDEKQLKENPSVCGECGAANNHEAKDKYNAEYKKYITQKAANDQGWKQIEHHESELESLDLEFSCESNLIEAKEAINTYGEQLEAALDEVNPHVDTIEGLKASIKSREDDALSFTNDFIRLSSEVSDIDLLVDVTDTYRGVSVKNTMIGVENKTNQLLSDYFDAEIKVAIILKNAENVEVEISKDGNTCSFSQLSKGQRQLLKLCFGVAIMQSVQNFHAVKFEQVFFDESLDGLDDDFKVKAYRLLQSLELQYSSIFVVEHSSSLKELFQNKVFVELVDGRSVVEKS